MTAYIAAPPAFTFQMTLLTLLCLERTNHVPTRLKDHDMSRTLLPTSRPKDMPLRYDASYP